MKNKIKNSRVYGLHLTLDGYGADSQRLNDINLLFETLNELPGKIKMNKIGFPHIAQFTNDEIAGISGIIMIVESHISIHTYPKKKFISMDVYSCQQFDHNIVINSIEKIYKIKDKEINLIRRGKKFPVNNIC